LLKIALRNSRSIVYFTVTQNHQKFGEIKSGIFIPFNYEIGQRSQDLKPLYFENGLLYITKAALILENRIISEKAFPYLVNHIFAKVDIDTQEDFDYAAFFN
jgi:N-acylneuraminate cytidylyltransferase